MDVGGRGGGGQVMLYPFQKVQVGKGLAMLKGAQQVLG